MPSIFNILGGENRPTATTKNGEITVNLNLTLTLRVEQDGTVRVVDASSPAKPADEAAKQYESPFLGNERVELIDFGKKGK
jgi:hypothetical protein